MAVPAVLFENIWSGGAGPSPSRAAALGNHRCVSHADDSDGVPAILFENMWSGGRVISLARRHTAHNLCCRMADDSAGDSQPRECQN